MVATMSAGCDSHKIGRWSPLKICFCIWSKSTLYSLFCYHQPHHHLFSFITFLFLFSLYFTNLGPTRSNKIITAAMFNKTDTQRDTPSCFQFPLLFRSKRFDVNQLSGQLASQTINMIKSQKKKQQQQCRPINI